MVTQPTGGRAKSRPVANSYQSLGANHGHPLPTPDCTSEEKQWGYHFLFLTPAAVKHQSVNIYGARMCGMSPVQGGHGESQGKDPKPF